MQVKVDSIRHQAMDVTQLAMQAQFVVQLVSTTVSTYEAKMNEVQFCAPAERCGTAQYIGQKREAGQSQNEMITCTRTGSII